MAYLDSRSVQGSGLFVRLAYWLACRRLGRVPAPLGVIAHHPGVLAATAAFELGFERARDLDVRLKELAVLEAASLVGCRFCIDLGGALAQGHGVSREKLLALPTYETSSVLTPLERRVLDFTVQMTETPSRPDPELFHWLQAELGVRALVELTAAIAWGELPRALQPCHWRSGRGILRRHGLPAATPVRPEPSARGLNPDKLRMLKQLPA